MQLADTTTDYHRFPENKTQFTTVIARLKRINLERIFSKGIVTGQLERGLGYYITSGYET